MNDYEKFEAFFNEMGISFIPVNNTDDLRFGDEPLESIYHLEASQAIFCFDGDKRYLGLLVADAMGLFSPRK